jgi:hypothetical protein
MYARGLVVCLPVLTLVLVGTPAHAQLNSGVSAVNLSANVSTFLKVTASPGTVNFPLVPNGTANGSATITVNTSWTVSFLIGNVRTYAYFTSPVAALTDGAGDNIPASSVTGSVNGGAFTAFTGATPFSGASGMQLSSTFIFLFNVNGNRTDTINMRINTTGLNLPAANYTGVLNIQAQAI